MHRESYEDPTYDVSHRWWAQNKKQKTNTDMNVNEINQAGYTMLLLLLLMYMSTYKFWLHLNSKKANIIHKLFSSILTYRKQIQPQHKVI